MPENNENLQIDDDTSLSEIKCYIRQNYNNGDMIDCPACGQRVKRYRRNVNASMTLVLIELNKIYNEDTDKWVHVSNLINQMNYNKKNVLYSFSTTKYWKLIVQRNMTRDDGSNRCGYWRLTSLGHDFVENNNTISKYVYVFNDIVDSFSDEQVSVIDCLGKKFNYNELMSQ